MRKFAGEWVSAVLTRLGMQDGEAIESRMVSRRIEGAQKKVEERNFDIRKNLLEYDEVMDEQRKRVYSFRQSLLDGAPPKEMILEMIDSQIADAARRFLADDYGAASFAEWVGQRLGIELAARDVKGASFEDAEEIAKSKAERQLRETIRQAMEENLPADADPSEWTWQALAQWANTRFDLNLKEKDLKKYAAADGEEFQFGQADLEDFLNERAGESLHKIDLSPAREFLEPDWGRRSLGGWAVHKFGMAIEPASWAELDRAEIVRRIQTQARELYTRKEAELPCRIALVKYLGERSQHQTPRFDREGLAAWASSRYRAVLGAEELRPLLRSEIETVLISLAQEHYQGGNLATELEAKLQAAHLAGTSGTGNSSPHHAGDAIARDPQAIGDLASWAHQSLGLEIAADKLSTMTDEEIRRSLLNALDAKDRPEMREMEKAVLLQILDSSWMEHLRAMDHLRSSIGLQGYAQIDPKVEYKREGMKIFAEMWSGIGDRTTDLIFRVEQFDPEFLNHLGSRWQLDRAQTIHKQAESALAAAPAAGNVRQQQEAAIAASERSTEKKREPVRNVGKKVGRNDPCPCGSGKKFKACCMRKQSMVDPF
jgi:preprotein translocase subunit SecA